MGGVAAFQVVVEETAAGVSARGRNRPVVETGHQRWRHDLLAAVAKIATTVAATWASAAVAAAMEWEQVAVAAMAAMIVAMRLVAIAALGALRLLAALVPLVAMTVSGHHGVEPVPPRLSIPPIQSRTRPWATAAGGRLVWGSPSGASFSQ